MSSGKQRSNRNRPRTINNSELSRSEVHFSDNDFPPLGTTSQQNTATASTFHTMQPTISSIHEEQSLTQNHYMQSGNRRIVANIQPLVPSTQPSLQPLMTKKPNAREKFPVAEQRQFGSAALHNASSSATTENIETHIMHSITMSSNIATDNNSTVTKQRPLTPHENKIYEKICEIILQIHKSKNYVSREQVQRELFHYFNVNSWHDLRVQASRFDALINLTDRQKDVTFYMHVFEQTFNLCTLNDLDALVARFMKVEKYDDLLLGPLDKNPEVRSIFKYKPIDPNQPIPKITTGEVIKKFIDFFKSCRHQRQMPFDRFLDQLVEEYQLESREELGLFCKSFPYLVQVTKNLLREQDYHMQQVQEESKQQIIEEVRAHLAELKEKMRDELELSSFNKKKTPTAVFNYLVSIVGKYLNFIPEQPQFYWILTQLRDDEMLRCLFNISIYLGTIEKPETFMPELQKLYGHQEKIPSSQDTMTTQQLSMLNEKMSKKDRRKMKAMMEQQQSQSGCSNLAVNEQTATTNTTFHTPFSTDFSSSFLTSHHIKSKTPVSFKQLCSDIYDYLVHYDIPLTIEELLKVDEQLCAQYHVTSFSAFSYDENDNDDNPANLISFLNKHRHIIDPHDELSVYEQTVSIDDQTDLCSFVQQLNIINNDEKNEEYQTQHVALTHGHIHTKQIYISAEKLSAVEKAIKHKFRGSVSFRRGNQIIRKAKKQFHKNKPTILRFEESLLDVNGLNQLDICPISLNVNETQLCQLILHCPLMINLHTWLQWANFFQPKYGTLRSFITKHENQFKDLRLLETSTGEVFRLPIDANLAEFEYALNTMHIRSAVGYLCSLIIKEVQIRRFPINVYRTSMDAWFCHLRSLATLDNDHIDPMQHILEFLMYLPVLIGQSRIIEELILVPLDKVFGDVSDNTINPRTKLWNLANTQQRIKLEAWGYTVNVDEWKNEKKWSGYEELEERASDIKSENEFIQQQTTNIVSPSPSTATVTELFPIVTTNTSSNTSTSATLINMDNENDSCQAAFEHIESIRRGFGVDNSLDPNSQSVIKNLLGIIERSLDRLSNDLYLEHGHFLLELIQNADDNQYRPDLLPTLRFILSPERILVCNNEIGFQHANIAAICNVGASTKEKHNQGYAGHKGIGFKSVFMVSHRPEIHSRNYHICFDTSQRIGYTLPMWINQCEETLPNSDEWKTCIRLPIKKEAQDTRLKDNFKKIESIFLLFLNRLRQIELIDQYDKSATNNNSRTFTRIDHDQGQVIELQEKTMNRPVISNLWLVVKKQIEVPANIKEKLRDVKGDVDSTIIAIAFPLNGIQDSSLSSPPTQPVFAYLPLCSYGFRFILQGDFEVPANRQEILHDNLWNEWLQWKMTCLLSLAYYQFRHLPDLLASSTFHTQINYQITPIQTIKYFLKFFPLQNESKPFFNKFVDESIKSLAGIIKLPVSRQNEKEETIIDWVAPSQCIIVQDAFIRKILSQDLLLSHFNSYYVHEQLMQECNEQILLKLGCRQLDFSDITQLIETSYKQKEQQHIKTTSAIEQIAQWLVCLDYSLQQQRQEINFKARESDTINKLKQLKIIPLKDQSQLVSVNEFDKYPISFPWEKSIKYSKHLKLVLDDIPTIDEQLLNFIEDKYPRRLDSIKRLLQNLGINKSHNIREIYLQHMLPVMSDQTHWSLKSESVLIAYLLCIYEYIYSQKSDLFENELKILKSKVLIKTRDNKFVSLGSPDVVVHLTLKYGCKDSLESLRLSNYQFIFISDDYYNEFCLTELFLKSHDVHSFVIFLKKLNINDFLQVDLNETRFIGVQNLADTKWAYLIPKLSEMIHEPFIIQDFCCEEFNKLVTPLDANQTVDHELCVQLLQYLDRHYQYVSHYFTGSVMLVRGHQYGQNTPIKGIESSFTLSVRQHAWIPVVGDALFKPSDVYLLPSNSPTYAFRRYIPHLDESKVSLKSLEFIHNILGIKSQVKHRTIFELFMKWSCNLDSQSLWDLIKQTETLDIIPCTLPNTFRQSCIDTIDNLRPIYAFLASNDETRRFLSRFRLWPIIFIPRKQNTGDFLFVQQTFWTDPISLLSTQDIITDSNGRIPIQSYYNDDSILNIFFLEILHVELHPTIDDYLPLLSVDQDINKIWLIIQIITKLAAEQNKQKEVQGFSIDTNFQEQFCSLFDIENLRKVIQTKVHVENEQSSTHLAEFYHCSIDLIQYFLLSKQFISATHSADLSFVFARMHFVCVDRIDLSYCYGTDIIKTESTNYNKDTYIDEQSSKFYILKKFEHSETRYIDAMINFIVEDEGIRSQLLSYIKKLLQQYQNEGEKSLAMLRTNCTENYEPKWKIPKEIKKDVPSPPAIEEKTEKPEITRDEIEQLKDMPSTRRNRIPKKVTDEDNTSQLTCFPAKASTIETNEIPESKTKPKPKDSTERENPSSNANSTNEYHRESGDYHRGNHEHGISKNKTTEHTDENLDKNELNKDEIKQSKGQFVQPHAPMTFSNTTSLPPVNFECISFSTLPYIDSSTSPVIDGLPSADSLRPIATETDLATGRQGEQLVFGYLKWKYPNADINWVNQEVESGKPYDIHMIIKSENNREEFIEVKTTRSYDQNTFAVSIGEVEYLLNHPLNYYIYRVYYADKIELSTIKVISTIKTNLLNKHLKLSMTYESKQND
ncbi:unnamed protein product [Rotaria sordida]|uniref:Protein NO VEIN C-terminal domain-containing protein n=1 Tax=Rotaria sordida TaxID=392033 RepID=A0A815KWN7_9BILA|nr:unnamed protein product [Rotaria sordida]